MSRGCGEPEGSVLTSLMPPVALGALVTHVAPDAAGVGFGAVVACRLLDLVVVAPHLFYERWWRVGTVGGDEDVVVAGSGARTAGWVVVVVVAGCNCEQWCYAVKVDDSKPSSLTSP